MSLHREISLIDKFIIRPTPYSRLRCQVVIVRDLHALRKWQEKFHGVKSSRSSDDGVCNSLDITPFFAQIVIRGDNTEFVETVIHECVHAALEYLNRLGIRLLAFGDATTKRQGKNEERLCHVVDWMGGAIIRKFMFRTKVKL